ncbi:MAG: GGDEF domain-containing protein [Actinomycetota bacterium]|nr:GGDEF domain-containing protein [Actinomycetota bacterium]
MATSTDQHSPAELSSRELAEFRWEIAKRETPWIAGAGAIVTFVLGMLNALIGVTPSFKENTPVLIASGIVAVIALVIGRDWVPASSVPWITAATSVVLVCALQLQEGLYLPPTGLVYALIVMGAFAPLILDYRAAFLAGIPMLIGCAWVASRITPPAFVDWFMVSLAAFFIGIVLLWLRMRGIDALAHALAHEKNLATVDPLSGMLNRRGLESLTPQLISLGASQELPVFALFVDIDGLKEVNDIHGHGFGDQVIIATANAIAAAVRPDDLIARWGGDEFVILGIGNPWEPEVLTQRIHAIILQGDINTQKWPGTVTVGGATTGPTVGNFDELMRQADQDMYARRAQQRSQDPV